MISLEPNILINISNDYSRKMSKVIKERYNQETKLKSSEDNLFTCEPYTALFDNGGTKGIDIKLVEDLLTKPLDYLCRNYKDINNYLLTCKLVYFSSFQIDKQLKKNNRDVTKLERERFRKNYVARFHNQWIENLITNHPYYYKNNELFGALIDDVEKKLDKLNNLIKKMVDYDFISADFRHEILTNIGIEVCPYCNRQYITKYTKMAKQRSTADLDHFLPKSIFQLLSLSLYNFVPSCQICNSRFKLAKSAEILYPYDRGFDNDVYFEVKLDPKSTVDSITGINTVFDLDLSVNPIINNKTEIENSIELFNLREVYQSHKDYVRELLYKKQAYTDSYQGQLKELFLDMKLDASDINLFLYGNNLNPVDFGKRPLSKLAHDIIKNN